MWSDASALSETNWTSNQFCGGYLDPFTLLPQPFIAASDNRQTFASAKGYICPVGQVCIEQENPYNGTQSFDNVFSSLLQVVIVMSCKQLRTRPRLSTNTTQSKHLDTSNVLNDGKVGLQVL